MIKAFRILRYMVFVLALLGSLSLLAGTSNSFCNIYISLRSDNKILILSLDSLTGSLQKSAELSVPGGPASLVADPTQHFLYVAQRSANSISAYRINPENGTLSLINTIPAVDNPVYLSIDKSGKFLLSAYFSANKAAVYSINADGSLQPGNIQVYSTGTNPHAILTDRSNRFLYITNMTGNQIEQFSFDSSHGTFSPLDQKQIVPPDNTGPRHLVFNLKGNVLYTVNELGNSISAYRFNEVTGHLFPFQTISALPPSFSGSNKSADIHITPDNRFLYASNRGNESIAAFKIHPDTDSLSAIGYFPTVISPREIEIDPSGAYLFSAGETLGNLRWYRINQENGLPDSLGTIAVGKTPSWILALDARKTTGSSSRYTPSGSDNGIEMNCKPNPFYDTLTISFTTRETAQVCVTVTDLSGHNIETLQSGLLKSGFHSIQWNTAGKNLSTGAYLCILEIDGYKTSMKLTKTGNL